MIYLDNGAGSWPKPATVGEQMQKALGELGANPGRSSYALSRHTEAMVETVRKQLAALFSLPNVERAVFTPGATASLNMAILGYLGKGGGHAVISSLEHNAVRRPLEYLRAAGMADFTVVQGDEQGYVTAKDYAKAIRSDTRLLVLNHGSNVCGAVQPVADIALLAKEKQIPLLLDASQTAGLLPIDVSALDLAMLAVPAHKGLYGPAGVGMLYVKEGIEITPVFSGGTGEESEAPLMPKGYPQHLEAGSLPVPNIAGWGAALSMVEAMGVSALYQWAMHLTRRLVEGFGQIPGVKLFWQEDERPRLPVLSLVVEGQDPWNTAHALDNLGVCVRSGYHCSPLAHETLGTFGEGTVRFTPGRFNTEKDIQLAILALAKVVKEK